MKSASSAPRSVRRNASPRPVRELPRTAVRPRGEQADGPGAHEDGQHPDAGLDQAHPRRLHDEVRRIRPEVPVGGQPLEQTRDPVPGQGQRRALADEDRRERAGQADEQQQAVGRPPLRPLCRRPEGPRHGQGGEQQHGDQHASGDGGAAPPHLERADGSEKRGERQRNLEGQGPRAPAGAPHRPQPDEADGHGGCVCEDPVFLVDQQTGHAPDERPHAHLGAGGSAVGRRGPRRAPDRRVEPHPPGHAERVRNRGGRDEAAPAARFCGPIPPQVPGADREQRGGQQRVLRVQPRQRRCRQAEQQGAPRAGRRRHGRAVSGLTQVLVADRHRRRHHDREGRRDLGIDRPAARQERQRQGRHGPGKRRRRDGPGDAPHPHPGQRRRRRGQQEHQDDDARVPAQRECRGGEQRQADRVDRVHRAVAARRDGVRRQVRVVVRGVVPLEVVVLDPQVVVLQQALRHDQVVGLVASREQARRRQRQGCRAEDQGACREHDHGAPGCRPGPHAEDETVAAAGGAQDGPRDLARDNQPDEQAARSRKHAEHGQVVREPREKRQDQHRQRIQGQRRISRNGRLVVRSE